MRLFTGVYAHKNFPYRKARGTGIMLKIPYKAGDEVHKFEQELCRQTKVAEDNHHGFLVENKEGQSLYLWFTDWRLLVCLGYEET